MKYYALFYQLNNSDLERNFIVQIERKFRGFGYIWKSNSAPTLLRIHSDLTINDVLNRITDILDTYRGDKYMLSEIPAMEMSESYDGVRKFGELQNMNWTKI